jgi:hypothetical protein
MISKNTSFNSYIKTILGKPEISVLFALLAICVWLSIVILLFNREKHRNVFRQFSTHSLY